MKKLLAFVLAILLIPTACAYAVGEYDGYIVKIKDDCPSFAAQSLFSLSDNADENYIIVDEEDIDGIDMSDVEYILPNYKLIPMDYTPNDTYFTLGAQWSFDLIKIQYAWNKGFFGRELSGKNENVRIAVIDTGIDQKHPDLEERIVATESYVKDDAGVVDPDDMQEDTKHGTSVAGTAAAIMNNGIGTAGVSQADIVALRASAIDELKQAVEDAVDKYDCDVINISLGLVFAKYEYADIPSTMTETDYNTAIQNTIRDFLSEPIRKATEKGVIVVAAAGNYGKDGVLGYKYPNNPVVYPAYCSNVISAGSVGEVSAYTEENGVEYAVFSSEAEKKVKSYFSTYNDMVDVSAPGEWIYAPVGNYSRVEGMDYDHVNGTSFSSPQVAAAAAIVKGINPEFDHDSFELLLKFTAEDLGDSGRDDYYGWGLLNIEEMVKLANGEKLGVEEPEYDAETNTLTLTYADFGAATGSKTVRAAVYNSDNTLISLTAAKQLPQTVSGELTVDVIIDGVEIPSGGYAKVYCMSDWAKMIPAANVAIYKS